MSREKNLAKNTVILAVGTFLPKFSSFITLPIITAGLTKAEYGTYELINTLVSLFLPIVTLQIQTAAFRFLIDCRDDIDQTNDVVSNLFFFIIFVSTISLAILFFALSNLAIGIRLLICAFFYVDILLHAAQQTVRGLSNNVLYSASSIIKAVINIVVVVLTIAHWKQGLSGVLISSIVASIVGIALLLFKGHIISHIHINNINKKVLKSMLAYSWPMVPNSLSGWVLSVSDRLVLSGILGLEASAIYAAANKIPSLLSSLQGTFTFAWQENASIAVKDDDKIKYYSKMFDSIFSIVSGVLALLIASTPLLFKLLIKGDYSDSYPQMPILFMGIFFSTMSSFMGGIYVAHKKTFNVGITTMIAAAINLAIDLSMVNIIGVFAASFSTLVSYLFLYVYRVFDVKKFQNIIFNHKKNIICIFLLSMMCMGNWANYIFINIINAIFGVIFAVILNRKLIVSITKSVLHKYKKRIEK